MGFPLEQLYDLLHYIKTETERKREKRERGEEKDRQSDRQTDRQTGRQTARQTDSFAYNDTGSTEIWTAARHDASQIGRQADR